MTYAMAMLLVEAAAKMPSPPKLTIFGTDDDEDALSLARAGRFPPCSVLGLDQQLRDRYMIEEGNAIRVKEALRELCLFSRHKLTRDTPMARMDLVICHRVFDGIAVARRPQLIEELYYSLRDGGLLVALDHGDRFPVDRFERLGAGLLRARPSHGVQSVAAARAAALARRSSSPSEERGSLAPFLHMIGVPLLLWDARLRLLFASPEAMMAFGLVRGDLGRDLAALSRRLPGGADLLPATWRAATTQATEELSIRAWGRAYLARISAAAHGISIVFSDVTQLALAHRDAVAQAREEAALARISELALTLAEPQGLCDEALGVLFAHLPTCSGGVIVEVGSIDRGDIDQSHIDPIHVDDRRVDDRGGEKELEVVASRGLGDDPLQTLRALGEPARLLDAVAERAGRARSVEGLDAQRAARELRSAKVHAASSSVIDGVACPITHEGRLVGIIGLFGPRSAGGEWQYDHLVQSVANVLGAALGRQRTRRRLALELEVSTLLAGAASLEAVGPGLKRAFGMLPAVEVVEIWARRSASAPDWQKLMAEADAAAPSWPAELPARLARGAVQLSWSDGGRRELLVALVRRDAPLAVLRLAGRGLRKPDAELDAGLRRAAHLLADFLERASILERSRRTEAALREADQQKDDFLAMLGHELRNPMAAIRNATELLSRLEPPTPQLLRLQSIFDRQALQTTKLIDGLLDIARVARGKVELQLGPVQVLELVRQVVDDRRHQFQQRERDLRLPLAADLWVQADRVRLVQILDNLISNALKFTPPNGRIRLEVAHSSGRGVIRVEDDGQGIDPELMPKIFEPFRQGRPTTPQSRAGLGLGLALVKGLVELHGFQLRAASPGVGGGASFEIEFGLIDAPESRPPESRVDMRALELLLIEDNVDIAETLGELLAASGHRVETVGSAELALEHLRRRRPDIVLCDLGLPGMDGLELATRLRADPELSGLKLVAMTGFGDASTQSRVEQAGFDRILIKPVQLEALRHCLSRVAASCSHRVSRG
jgi:signal transduction histidine kinase/CheY-like chemotaxis protein